MGTDRPGAGRPQTRTETVRAGTSRGRAALDSPIVVDCGTCPGRGMRCDDCMVAVLAGRPVLDAGAVLPLDAAERRAVGRLVSAGLVTREQAGAVVAQREPWPGVESRPHAGARAVG